MPSIELGDLTLGDNKPATLEDKEFVWEQGLAEPEQQEDVIWMINARGESDPADMDTLFLRRMLDGTYEVDDSFAFGVFNWRKLENVKDLNEAMTLCETLWRMR